MVGLDCVCCFFSQQSIPAWAVGGEIQRLSQPCLGVRAGVLAGAPVSAQLAMPALQTGLGPSAEHPKPAAVALCGPSPAADPPSQLWGSLQHSHSSVPIWEVESHYSTVLSRVGLRCSPGLPSGTEAFFSIWRCLGITRTQCQTHFQGVSHSLTIPQVMLPPWDHFTRFKLLTAHPHLLPGPDCPAKA